MCDPWMTCFSFSTVIYREAALSASTEYERLLLFSSSRSDGIAWRRLFSFMYVNPCVYLSYIKIWYFIQSRDDALFSLTLFELWKWLEEKAEDEFKLNLRVRVGRGGDKKGYSSNWAGAVMQKPPVNAVKAKHGQTDRLTDWPIVRQTNGHV